jgi:hypothetical protein
MSSDEQQLSAQDAQATINNDEGEIGTSGFAPTTEKQVPGSKRLLDLYLSKTKPEGGHNPHTNPEAYAALDNSDPVSDSEITPPAVPAENNLERVMKELGSLEEVLKGKVAPEDETTPFPEPPQRSIYEDENLFAQEPTQSDVTGPEAFTPEPATSGSPIKNLALIALGLFGIGAAIFGIRQLITQAEPNFAAPNISSPATPMPITPRIMSFQGRLTYPNPYVNPDLAGQPRVGTFRMEFKLFDMETSGQAKWESHECTVTTNSAGIFNVNLGAGQGLGSDNYNCGPTLSTIFTDHTSIWIEISVDSEILSPRQLVKSVPYALNASALQGLPASASATANSIPFVDSAGNFNFNTSVTAIANTGDLYLMPGSGNLYVGTPEQNSNLVVAGNATVSGSLTAASIVIGAQGLKFQTTLGENVWQLTADGRLGLGTTAPYQQLSLKNGNLAFEFEEKSLWSGGQLQLALDSNDGGHLSEGDYYYRFTCVDNNGKESQPSEAELINIPVGNRRRVIIDNISYNSPACDTINIYRSLVNSLMYYQITNTANPVSQYADELSDDDLKNNKLLHEGGGIYAGKTLSLQFTADGSLATNRRLNTANHGDNQGFKLPLYSGSGAPTPANGQEAGDIVYGVSEQTLYVYNGSEFIAVAPNSANCYGSSCRLDLEPEYVNAVIHYLTHNTSDSEAGLYTISANTSSGWRNYYEIKSKGATEEKWVITINQTLPANFRSWQDDALTLEYAAASDTNLELALNGSTVPIALTKDGGWQQLIIPAATLSNLSLPANGTLTLKITLTNDITSDTDLIKLGHLSLFYQTK